MYWIVLEESPHSYNENVSKVASENWRIPLKCVQNMNEMKIYFFDRHAIGVMIDSVCGLNHTITILLEKQNLINEPYNIPN